MSTINSSDDFEKKLVSEYLKCGSINKVFQKHQYNLPISFAGYDRLLTKYGVVKSAGPNSQFSESLYLMKLLANYKIPLERLYHQHAPHSIQVSTNTLHRILHYTRLGMTRRQGAILIITPQNEPGKVLIGNDLSLSRTSIMGQRGDLTLPMGHSKAGESPKDSLARILQNEVFSNATINRSFPWKMIPDHLKPLMYINLADICVSVYKLTLPVKYPHFSSFKLKNLELVDISKIDFSIARPGVKDVLDAYLDHKHLLHPQEALTITSELNAKIYALAQEPVE
jgi:hypothetical protein